MMPKIDRKEPDNLAARLRKGTKAQLEVVWELRPEILLCGNVPRPLHGVAPRVVLGTNWWNRNRRQAYLSTNFHCQACGVHKEAAKYHQWLEGHEVYDIDYIGGRMTYLYTAPLCHFCHNYIHSGRLAHLLEQGKIHHSKYAKIIQHGDQVLHKAGLVKPPPYPGPFATWGSWRLIVEGKAYPPKFKTEKEWIEGIDE